MTTENILAFLYNSSYVKVEESSLGDRVSLKWIKQVKADDGPLITFFVIHYPLTQMFSVGGRLRAVDANFTLPMLTADTIMQNLTHLENLTFQVLNFTAGVYEERQINPEVAKEDITHTVLPTEEEN